MTTRRDTKKFELLQSSPKVAILVHDFPQVRAGDACAGQQPQESMSPPPPPPPPGSKGKVGWREGGPRGEARSWDFELTLP